MERRGRSVRGRRPSWPRPAGPQATPPSDGGAAFLEGVARVIAARATAVFASCTDAQHGVPNRVACDRIRSGTDRSWRVRVGERDLWCVLDEAGQAEILALTLGGPGAKRQTAIERVIIGDCMAKLLAIPGAAPAVEAMREEPCTIPPSAQAWCCRIEIVVADGCVAVIALLTGCAEQSAPPSACRQPDVRPVPVDVAAHLAPWPVALGDMLQWRPGKVVPLPSGCGLRATLQAGATQIADAQIGSLETRRAVRLVSLNGRPDL
ncbi:MAG: FliM/FliN family flagellar motor switch protein [Candidatus Eremiobacteraeota bacterium]|nr:FliM/FliN family flagellar motor switch protein [Candidatus Eremiobacteraeota bacterium]